MLVSVSSSAFAPLGLDDEGLVANGVTLMRMDTKANGTRSLAIDRDAWRLVTLLSVAGNRPVDPDVILPPLAAAAAHWERGDKALANLRLVFSPLQKILDQTGRHRLGLAGQLLDAGWAPADLLVELGLEKYDPDQRRVPAGHPTGGEWTDDTASGERSRYPGAFDVAESGDKLDEDLYEERRLLGTESPGEDVAHGHSLQPPHFGGSASPLLQIQAAARAAADKVGPGAGPVYGTNVHTEFKAQIQQLGHDDLHAEKSYLKGHAVDYGTPGSVRADVVEPSVKEPTTVYDLKTGAAVLTEARKNQLRAHLPAREDGEDIEIHEVRP